MKEYNFFEAVMEEKKGTNYFGLLVMFAIVGVFVWLLYHAGTNFFEYRNLNREIDSLRAKIDLNRDMVEQLNEVREEARLLEERFDYLYRADLLARSSRFVTLELFEVLPALTPARLILNSVSVAGSELQITGISPDLETIAQFGHSLYNSDFFNNPIIESAHIDRRAANIVGGIMLAQEYGGVLAGPYRFNATADIRWDGVVLLDLLFNTDDDFILRATDPDVIWDGVMAGKQLSELGVTVRGFDELMEAIGALLGSDEGEEEDYEEEDEYEEEDDE